MTDYDKAMELVIGEDTMKHFTAKEIRTAGKVLIYQALIKEGYTVDALTEYHVAIQDGSLQIRVKRGNAH